MEGQTIQWSKDTKEVITSRKWKDRQCNGQKIPKRYSQAVNERTDNPMVKSYQSGNHKRKWKDRQYNGQKIPKW